MYIKKYLAIMFLFIISSVSYSNDSNFKSFSSTYETSKFMSTKTTKLEIMSLSNLNNLNVDIKVKSKTGSITFKLIDKDNKVIFEYLNPKEIEKNFSLNFNEKYQLLIDLKDFSGKYEIKLKSSFKNNWTLV